MDNLLLSWARSSQHRNTGRFGRASESGTAAGRVPHAPCQPRVVRFVRRGPQGKRLQPGARLPALEQLPHKRRRQALDYHGIRPLRDHALVARRVLNRKISSQRQKEDSRLRLETLAMPAVSVSGLTMTKASFQLHKRDQRMREKRAESFNRLGWTCLSG